MKMLKQMETCYEVKATSTPATCQLFHPQSQTEMKTYGCARVTSLLFKYENIQMEDF